MQSIYIKFASETDRARGFLELAKHSGIISLPGQVYQVRREALPVLKKNRINYRKATIAEVSFCRDISKHHRFRNKNSADELAAELGSFALLVHRADRKSTRLNSSHVSES